MPYCMCPMIDFEYYGRRAPGTALVVDVLYKILY